MMIPKQIQLVKKLIDLTDTNKIKWERYSSPNSFMFMQGSVKYIVSSYKTSSENTQYDCFALLVTSEAGKVIENCVGCNAIEYVEDFEQLKPLYTAINRQFRDWQLEDLLQELPA